jgi:hypothetical protein
MRPASYFVDFYAEKNWMQTCEYSDILMSAF